MARTVLPGDSRRAVIKLEFENPAADPSNARSWIPSSFGRYMVVRIPKQSLDMFLKLENELIDQKGDYYHPQDPYYAMINSYGNNYGSENGNNSHSFFSSSKKLLLGNTPFNGQMNNQIYPYPYPNENMNGPTLSKAYNRLGLAGTSSPSLSSPYMPRKEVYDENNGGISDYTPGSITGQRDNDAALWSRGRINNRPNDDGSTHPSRHQSPNQRYLQDTSDPRGEDTDDNRYDVSSPRSLGTPYSKRVTNNYNNRGNNYEYSTDDRTSHLSSPNNRLYPGNLSVHLSTTSTAAALNGGLKAVSSGTVVERPYSIVRADGKRGLIMYIRRYPEGSVSRWMYGLPIGAEVVMTGPKGLGLHLDDSQGGVIVGIYQGTCSVTAFDLIQHIAAMAEEKRKLNGIRKNRAPTWSREQWEAAHRNPNRDPNNQGNPPSSTTLGSSSTSRQDNPTLMEKKGSDTDADGDNSNRNTTITENNKPLSGDTSASSDNEETVTKEKPPVTEAYKTLFPVPKDSNSLRVGNVSTTLAGGTRRLGIIQDNTDRSATASTGGPPKRYVRLPPLHNNHSAGMNNGNVSNHSSSPQPYARFESKDDNYSNEDIRYRTNTTTGEINSDDEKYQQERTNTGGDNYRSSRGDDHITVNHPDQPPRFKLVLMVVFEHEDAIIEREWLQHMDAICDDFELHINLSHVRNKRKVTEMALPRLTLGRLTPTRLERLLPPRNLLVVSLCGTPKFQKDIRDIYESLGLPKSLLSVVA